MPCYARSVSIKEETQPAPSTGQSKAGEKNCLFGPLQRAVKEGTQAHLQVHPGTDWVQAKDKGATQNPKVLVAEGGGHQWSTQGLHLQACIVDSVVRNFKTASKAHRTSAVTRFPCMAQIIQHKVCMPDATVHSFR